MIYCRKHIILKAGSLMDWLESFLSLFRGGDYSKSSIITTTETAAAMMTMMMTLATIYGACIQGLQMDRKHADKWHGSKQAQPTFS